jgi:hypothetical protein
MKLSMFIRVILLSGYDQRVVIGEFSWIFAHMYIGKSISQSLDIKNLSGFFRVGLSWLLDQI